MLYLWTCDVLSGWPGRDGTTAFSMIYSRFNFAIFILNDISLRERNRAMFDYTLVPLEEHDCYSSIRGRAGREGREKSEEREGSRERERMREGRERREGQLLPRRPGSLLVCCCC